ncbi:hypothetical protein [Streptomyces sp. CC219B]|uniref:hypothetical protein n=1 Tax=Streptomyces sp. CC219B TaxID=3044574 RepID=UPI0024A86620|nr:hypothetical protein [Streptomyces sp. CC219B]
MNRPPHPEHSAEELCAAGTKLYGQALREGLMSSAEVQAAPCLVDFGLLQPSVSELNMLEPVAPSTALYRMLRGAAERVADERRRQRLAGTFDALMEINSHRTGAEKTPAVEVLSGINRINLAITQAMAEASSRLLAIHPHISHTQAPPERHREAMARDQELLDRGGRIRALYQHTVRHLPSMLARYGELVPL